MVLSPFALARKVFGSNACLPALSIWPPIGPIKMRPLAILRNTRSSCKCSLRSQPVAEFSSVQYLRLLAALVRIGQTVEAEIQLCLLCSDSGHSLERS